MASRLFLQRMRRRVTGRWLFRRNRAHMMTHVTGRWLFRRKRTRATPDYSSLPDEIKEQILLKLQCIKSIVTCTSLSKSWHALIKSREFITMHLSRRDSNTGEYFLCSYFQQFRYSIEYYNSERLENYYDLIFPNKRVIVHGSCNGLICYTKFSDVSGHIYLWNPAIRKLKILPKSKYHASQTAYGFWCDTISDDYKVAKISGTKKFKVEVYSLSNNSWNIITTSGPSYSKTYFDDIVHVDGTLYWLASELRKNWRLISINIKNGMFRDTLIWPSGQFDCTLCVRNHSIFVLNNSYESVNIHPYDENLNELYRNEFEKSEKEILRSLGVRNNGNEVLLQKIGTDPPILVFDIGEFKFKEFCPSTKTILRLRPFAETLVLLDDGDASSIPDTWQGVSSAKLGSI